MKFRETMRAEMAPDVYAGKTCDQHKPRWVASADGDKDGWEPVGQLLELSAHTFPPGTKISVMEPCCPNCQEVPSLMDMPGQSGKWECGCDFDWQEFANNEYS